MGTRVFHRKAPTLPDRRTEVSRCRPPLCSPPARTSCTTCTLVAWPSRDTRRPLGGVGLPKCFIVLWWPCRVNCPILTLSWISQIPALLQVCLVTCGWETTDDPHSAFLLGPLSRTRVPLPCKRRHWLPACDIFQSTSFPPPHALSHATVVEPSDAWDGSVAGADVVCVCGVAAGLIIDEGASGVMSLPTLHLTNLTNLTNLTAQGSVLVSTRVPSPLQTRSSSWRVRALE